MSIPLFPGADAARKIPLIGSILSILLRVIRIGRFEGRIDEVELAAGLAANSVNEAANQRFLIAEDLIRALQTELSLTKDKLNEVEAAFEGLEMWKESVLGRIDQSVADMRVLWRASLARNGLAVERAAQAIADRGLAAGQSGPFDGFARLSAPEMAVDLEEALSGDRDVTARARFYLPRVAALRTVKGGFPVLDLGAGQGVWLAALKQAGIHAIGADVNPVMVDIARAKGVDVVLADALGHLRDRDPGSLGAVTGLRLVEHLPFEQTVALIQAAMRALAPGGLLMLETLNPENLVVGGCAFWADPSRLRPIPPALLTFHVAAAGFEKIETLRFVRHADAPDTATVDQPVEPSLTAPMDYAVAARKPVAD